MARPSQPAAASSCRRLAARRAVRRAAVLGLLLVGLGLSGCTHRRMTITSDPPGALVMIDGEERGLTPYSMDFYYYGTHEIKLVKPGYETLTVMQKVPRPWYQYLPFEFFSDNFYPPHVTDRHRFHYPLQPQVIVPAQDLLNRANGLRAESQIAP